MGKQSWKERFHEIGQESEFDDFYYFDDRYPFALPTINEPDYAQPSLQIPSTFPLLTQETHNYEAQLDFDSAFAYIP